MNQSTSELTEELSQRAGVIKIVVEPYQEIKITVGQEQKALTGPAVILINQD